MTLLAAAPLEGLQRPRVEHRPPWVSEDAAVEAIELAASAGLVLDPWQQTVVRAALAERSDGSWAASEVGFLVARQNGKGGALEAIVLHGLFLVGDPLTLWTAHQFKTTAEAFLRIRGWVDGSDDLRRLVARVTTANGDEGIELRSGPRLRFVARSKSSGRGFSPQRVIFDEAQELSTLAVEAMLMATSAQPNRQTIYTGTVPGPENNAEHWTSLRDRGRQSRSSRLAWLEWTPRGSDDPKHAAALDLDDRRVWAASNPALGYRISEETVASERETLVASPESFARERLSVWPTLEGGSGVISAASWRACRSAPEPVSAPVVLAVDTTLDRSQSVLVACGTRVDGLPQLEVIDSRPGTGWVAARAAEVAVRNPDVADLVVDGRAASKSLLPDIEAALADAEVDVAVSVTSTSDVAEGCGQVFDAIVAGRLRHLGDPLLDAAVSAAVQRSIGDGAWAWSRRNGGPAVTPLIAATLAYWRWRALAVDPYDPLANIY